MVLAWLILSYGVAVRRFGNWSGGGFSLMNVDKNVSGSRSYLMSMIVVALVMVRVQGAANARGCGFMGLFSETLVLDLFTTGSVQSTMPKI
jgi:hypothetical protein